MSMRNNGCSGYTVKASELTKLLPLEHQAPYQELLESNDDEEIAAFLNTHLSKDYPVVESVFILNDEAESDDLEIGEVYALFSESDLFLKVPSEFNINLKEAGINLECSSWVTFG